MAAHGGAAGAEASGGGAPVAASHWQIPVSVARVDVSSVSEIFNPEYKERQLKLCDHVNLWSQVLACLARYT